MRSIAACLLLIVALWSLLCVQGSRINSMPAQEKIVANAQTRVHQKINKKNMMKMNKIKLEEEEGVGESEKITSLPSALATVVKRISALSGFGLTTNSSDGRGHDDGIYHHHDDGDDDFGYYYDDEYYYDYDDDHDDEGTNSNGTGTDSDGSSSSNDGGLRGSSNKVKIIVVVVVVIAVVALLAMIYCCCCRSKSPAAAPSTASTAPFHTYAQASAPPPPMYAQEQTFETLRVVHGSPPPSHPRPSTSIAAVTVGSVVVAVNYDSYMKEQV
mmetsp:Transcript_11258/g.25032  ORF Transcript_11258/g.25032 Transcript_11258/m.25032 type:complete len:271 (-) Transcript_11258:199-1011(-)|eukprot:CAMPEP_0173235068 /NCGR_PEP_ID=MMETSP1142-20121109/10614_1 /TAXON_ID=483371 /ORGANISM="non described non described, Strain CCMP2298" /LENGTH=270 /DNA_ID=CAMNT_0014165255 /DNA_START=29 /DNA_END=841 /DNA_ORIENTATION=+